MDYEKYYLQKRDGSYSVHFANWKGLSLDEIKTLFSQYGEVLSVNATGNEYGLRFVRYANVEDTIKCIDGFHNTSVRILRQKSKIFPTNSNQENNSQKSWGQHEKSHGQMSQRNTDTFLNKTFKNKQSDKWRALNNDVVSDISSTSKESWIYDKISNSSQKSNSRNRTVMESSTTPDLVQCKDDNGGMRLSPVLSCVDDSNIKSNTYDKEEIPELVSTTDIKLHQLCSNPSKMLSPRITIIPAAEVIVANVHPNFGIHYILHLFEKYEPISVTLMKVIPSTELRYCHVYFKSSQNAMEVEEVFDNYALGDNNLIVLRAQKCIEESTLP